MTEIDMRHIQIDPKESPVTIGPRKFHTTVRRYPDGTVTIVDVSLCPLNCPDETGSPELFRQSHPVTADDLPGGPNA